MSHHKRNNKPRPIAAIPKFVMEHEDYFNLSGNAVKLLMEFCRQYNKHNNGKLCAVWSQLKKRGWRSEATLQKTLKELKSANLIELTKAGGWGQGGKKPNYYALTWEPIDDISGFLMDIEPTSKPSRPFLRRVA